MSKSDVVVSKDTVEKFLKKHHFAVLSTVREDGTPDAAAMYFFWENDELFFLTKKDMQKFKNIEHQNHVILTVTDIEKQITTKIEGKAFDFGKDPKKLTKILDHLSQRLEETSNLPFLNHEEKHSTIIRVVPTSLLYRDYHGGTAPYDEGVFTFS